MARVPYVTREGVPEDYREFYDKLADANGGTPIAMMRLLMNAPEAALRIARLATYVRWKSPLSDDVREIVILTTAREIRCQYEFSHHAPLARKAGVPEATIKAITEGGSDGLPTRDALLVDYVRRVIQKRVDDTAFAAVERELGREGAAEATILAGFYTMVGYAMDAFGVELEPGYPAALPTA